MSRALWVRAALGLFLAAMSVGALAGPVHVKVLGAAEIVFALLYAWPRAPRWADAGLLGVLLVAIAVHAVDHQFAALPVLAAMAVLALWRKPPVGAVEPADREALAIFTLRSPGEFTHLAHVRVARLYLQQLPLGEAIECFSADLRRYAKAQGAAAKFHQTVTVAFVLLIRARLAQAPEGESFEAFLARNPDLGGSQCLKAFYSEAALASPLAKRDFVFPDRVAAEPAR
jgi:hypothetical protein